MRITQVSRSHDKVWYKFYKTRTAQLPIVREFYYSHSWLPDIMINIVSIQEFVESYHKDFTQREFFTELMLLVTSYQELVVTNCISPRGFDMKIKNLNYHMQKMNINIKLDL